MSVHTLVDGITIVRIAIVITAVVRIAVARTVIVVLISGHLRPVEHDEQRVFSAMAVPRGHLSWSWA